MIAVSPKSERWFTPAEEEGAERPTRFKLRPMTHGEKMRFVDEMGGARVRFSGSVPLGSMVRFCLPMITDVENFPGEDGKNIEFEASEAFYDRIPWGVQQEIANDVVDKCGLATTKLEKSEPLQEESQK